MRKASYWYRRIADALEEMIVVSLVGDKNGYPSICWIIAAYMLRGLSAYDRHRKMDYYVVKVKNNLDHAVRYLEERGVKVYKALGEGEDANKRAIEILTLDPNYRTKSGTAKSRDYERLTRYFEQEVSTIKTGLVRRHPEKIGKFIELGKRKISEPFMLPETTGD